MDSILRDIASNVIPMIVGAIGSAIVWVIKAMLKAKCDIDFAHAKIRELEKIIKLKE